MIRFFLTATAILSALFAGATAAPADTITVMSYNIRNSTGMDNVRDFDRTAAVISAANPSVVAILEVDSITGRSKGTYVLGELAQRSGMQPFFAPAIDYDGGRYGIGLLAAETPLSVVRHALPGREEARALIIAEFKDFIFAATHLSLTEEDALESASIISGLFADAKKPVIIAGDFNVTPGSETTSLLSKQFTMVNNPEIPTFPADEPNTTIDYIMIKGEGMDAIECEVVNAPTQSDHRPLVVKLLVK